MCALVQMYVEQIISKSLAMIHHKAVDQCTWLAEFANANFATVVLLAINYVSYSFHLTFIAGQKGSKLTAIISCN